MSLLLLQSCPCGIAGQMQVGGRVSMCWARSRAVAWVPSHQQHSGIPSAAQTAAASLVAPAQL